MGSETLKGMYVTQEWMAQFINHVSNGDGDKLAASRASVSTHVVQQKLNIDDRFFAQYTDAKRKRDENPSRGRRSW